MGRRVGWPLVVRLAHIEQASVTDAGQFAGQTVAPFPIPPFVSRWIGSFCVNTTEKVIALTYDDGPNPVHTPRILDLLAARGATATFFTLAPQVESHPEIAKRIVAEGHELALHGITHASLLTMTTSEAARAVRDAKRRVESVVGSRVRLYRPPYGEYSSQQAVRFRIMGLETVIWSGDSRDWAPGEEDDIAARAISESFPGGIILLHDHRGDPETLPAGEVDRDYDRAKVLAEILDHLDAEGYRTSGVGDLLKTHQRVRSIAKYGLDGIHQTSTLTSEE